MPEYKSIALSLSGGGFRATLFHIGVLRHLYVEDQLKKVRFVAGVSGGAFVAAYLAQRWDRFTALPETTIWDFDNRKHLTRCAWFNREMTAFKAEKAAERPASRRTRKFAFNLLARDLVQFIRRDPFTRAVSNLWLSRSLWLWPILLLAVDSMCGWYSGTVLPATSALLGLPAWVWIPALAVVPVSWFLMAIGQLPWRRNWAFEMEFERLYGSLTSADPWSRFLGRIRRQFSPSVSAVLRIDSGPTTFLGTLDYQTGHLCWFSHEGFVRVPGSNTGKRGASVAGAAPFRSDTSLSKAVAASAAFPLFFPPVELKKADGNRTRYLGDGGIIDNLGPEVLALAMSRAAATSTQSFAPPDCVLISDAELAFSEDETKKCWLLASRVNRAAEVAMSRVSQDYLLPSAHALPFPATNHPPVILTCHLNAERYQIADGWKPGTGWKNLSCLRTDLTRFTSTERRFLVKTGQELARLSFAGAQPGVQPVGGLDDAVPELERGIERWRAHLLTPAAWRPVIAIFLGLVLLGGFFAIPSLWTRMRQIGAEQDAQAARAEAQDANKSAQDSRLSLNSAKTELRESRKEGEEFALERDYISVVKGTKESEVFFFKTLNLLARTKLRLRAFLGPSGQLATWDLKGELGKSFKVETEGTTSKAKYVDSNLTESGALPFVLGSDEWEGPVIATADGIASEPHLAIICTNFEKGSVRARRLRLAVYVGDGNRPCRPHLVIQWRGDQGFSSRVLSYTPDESLNWKAKLKTNVAGKPYEVCEYVFEFPSNTTLKELTVFLGISSPTKGDGRLTNTVSPALLGLYGDE